MTARKLLPRLLLPSGLVLVLLTLFSGLWQVGDALPRSLAGLFLTAFVPSTLGMLLVAVAIAFGTTRRWWAGCLSLVVLSILSIAGGMGMTQLMVKRKLAVERNSVVRRCAELRELLADHRAAQGSFPLALAGLAPLPVQRCALVDDAPGYAAAGGAYLLTLPGSSLDIDGSTFFAGAEGGWGWVHNDLRLELEQRLVQGESPEAAAGHDADALRYAALWRLVRGAGSAGAPSGGAGEPGGGQPVAVPQRTSSSPPPPPPPEEDDTWVVPDTDGLEGGPVE